MSNPNPILENVDLSAGHYVKGIELSSSVFIAKTTFNQIKQITRNPAHLQATAKKGLFDSDELEAEREIHDLIQRALSGNKAKNVAPYSTYIESVVEGGVGVLPPMHLWCQDPLDVVQQGINTYALIPNGEHLLAIDGETQLTAHYFLDEHATTPEIRKSHRDFPISCMVHHGLAVSTARQYFHDLNVLAVRPNTSLGLSMDTKDPVMKVVGDIEAIPSLQGRVEKQARQLKKNSPKIVTLQSLRQMVVNVAKGISGVQYGARPAPIEEETLPVLKDVCTGWIAAYLNAFNLEIADRENFLAGSGPVLAAVGAMGEKILQSEPQERLQVQAVLLDSLREVNWRKGEHWVGIAGNFTPSGVFSVKGTKEVSYAVFNALTDSDNSSYKRVRTGQAAQGQHALN
ncbi:UNVERIFIED_CONTAM: DndB-like DNA-sulfur modification-associated protein [Williamsia faeni]